MEHLFHNVQTEQSIFENDVPVVKSPLIHAALYRSRTSPGCFEGHEFIRGKELKAVFG